MSNEIAAAGIILLKQISDEHPLEVLLLKRNSTLKVHGGNWVFPGGKVDAEDYRAINHTPSDIDLRNPPALSSEDYLSLVTQTALRETQEEAGLSLPTDSLQFYSRWLTPKAIKKRFNTCFFIAKAASSKVTVDGSEIVDHQWISPSKGLALHHKGEIKVPPATYVSLLQLSHFEHAQTAIDLLCQKPIYYRPKLISIDGGMCSLYEDDAGYQDEDYFAEGKHHRLEMKPGEFNYINHFQ
jgi:8-oxo-dGTP pyrophosphatase MutT (NUDIX family)